MMHPKVYRAPELLFTGAIKTDFFVPPAEPVLTSGIDVWAMGCLFVGMSAGVSPFGFPNEHSYKDIMRQMVDRLGLPTPQQFSQWGAGELHAMPIKKQPFLNACKPWDITGVHPGLKLTSRGSTRFHDHRGRASCPGHWDIVLN